MGRNGYRRIMELVDFLCDMLPDGGELYKLTRDDEQYFAIDGLARIMGISHIVNFRIYYNKFAAANNKTPHLAPFKPQKGRGLPKLAFAPIDDLIAFLRDRKSDSSNALVARIDAALAEQARARLSEAERLLHDEEEAARQAEVVARSAIRAEEAAKEQQDRECRRAEKAERQRQKAEKEREKAEKERDDQQEADAAHIASLTKENARLRRDQQRIERLSQADRGTLITVHATPEDAAHALGFYEDAIKRIDKGCDAIQKVLQLGQGEMRTYLTLLVTTHLIQHQPTKQAVNDCMGAGSKAVQSLCGFGKHRSNLNMLKYKQVDAIKEKITSMETLFVTLHAAGILTFETTNLPGSQPGDGMVEQTLRKFEDFIENDLHAVSDYRYGVHGTRIDGKLLAIAAEDRRQRSHLEVRKRHLRYKDYNGDVHSHVYHAAGQGVFGQDIKESAIQSRRDKDRAFLDAFVESVETGGLRIPGTAYDASAGAVMESENRLRIIELMTSCGLPRETNWVASLLGFARLNKELETSAAYGRLLALPGAREFLGSRPQIGPMVLKGAKPTEYKTKTSQQVDGALMTEHTNLQRSEAQKAKKRNKKRSIEGLKPRIPELQRKMKEKKQKEREARIRVEEEERVAMETIMSESTFEGKERCFKTKGKSRQVALDAIAKLLGINNLMQVLNEYNRFAWANRMQRMGWSRAQKKGLPELEFAHIDGVIAFLRNHKSERSEALVAKIDAALVDALERRTRG